MRTKSQFSFHALEKLEFQRFSRQTNFFEWGDDQSQEAYSVMSK